MVNLNVRINDSEHSKLVQACQERGCNMSVLAREALRAYISEEKKATKSSNSSHSNDGNISPYEFKVTSDGRIWLKPAGSDIWEQCVRY